MLRGNRPGLRKIKHDVTGIIGGRCEAESSFVPLGGRIGKVEATAAGKAKLEGSKRLVAGVFELVDAFYSNDWLGWNKLHRDLLSDDRVTRTECRRTTASTTSNAGKQQ
jgi:hypothetical protein